MIRDTKTKRKCEKSEPLGSLFHFGSKASSEPVSFFLRTAASDARGVKLYNSGSLMSVAVKQLKSSVYMAIAFSIALAVGFRAAAIGFEMTCGACDTCGACGCMRCVGRMRCEGRVEAHRRRCLETASHDVLDHGFRPANALSKELRAAQPVEDCP